MKKEKILIFGPSWVGDMMMAKSLFTNLKKRNGNCELHLAAPGWSIGLAKRFDEIDKIIETDFPHGKLNLLKRIKLSIELRKENYDECIFLINTLKSLFSITFSSIPIRTGFNGEFRKFFLNNWHHNSNLPTIDKFTTLSSNNYYQNPKTIIPKLKPNKLKAKKFLNKRKIPHDKLVVIAGGAEFGPAKMLPQEKYGYIAKELVNNGFNVILLGSNKDIKVNNKINLFANMRCHDITGQTELDEVIDIIGICDYFLSNDSGLMHIAASLSIKQESFFGSSDPSNTPPLNKNSVINYLNIECSPCFERNCPLEHFKCMKLIDENKVLERILWSTKK